MRIEVVDPSGGGLGLAIGLAQLGHEVVHRGPTSRAQPNAQEMTRCSRDLQQRVLRAPQPGDGEADLLVLVDVFGDYLRSLQLGIGIMLDVVIDDPLQDGAGTLIYPHRLQYFCERAVAAREVAVLDCSDFGAMREVAFEAIPHAALFARECPAHGDGPWRPFPFLYNHAMLWLETLRPRGE